MRPFYERTPSEQPATAFARPRLIPDKSTPFGEPALPISELARGLDSINAEFAQKKAALEAELERAHAIQRRLAGLQRALDHVTDNLARAEEQYTSIQESITRVRALMPLAWTRPHGADYSFLSSAKEALLDWPRIKSLLQEQVVQAQAALAAFKREARL
jgi:chromosome segregation ATPase